MKLIIQAWFLILTATASLRAAEVLRETNTPGGRLILMTFTSAPYPHPSRAQGHLYHGKLFSTAEHYSDSTVAIFIPAGFQASNQVDFVVHFHGWMNTVDTTLKNYALADQFTAGGRNAILLVPEGPHDAPDSGGGKLEETNGFQRFIAEAMTTLKTRGLCPAEATAGRIILSGHSGGYQVMAAILDHGGVSDQVREVWLFDALYAHTADFLAWSARGQGRLFDIYTDHGGTKEETEGMISGLKQHRTSILATNDDGVSPGELRTNRFVFLHSDLPHNDVVAKRRMFQQLLETSCLPPRL